MEQEEKTWKREGEENLKRERRRKEVERKEGEIEKRMRS